MDEALNWYSLIDAQQQANNAWSAEQAQKAMDYQTYMSNTAHQREVADLKAAGLNPVLSAGGAGAAMGSGVAAQAGNENVSALYGLAKQAIEANLEQAKAAKINAQTLNNPTGAEPIAFDKLKKSGLAKESKNFRNKLVSASKIRSASDKYSYLLDSDENLKNSDYINLGADVLSLIPGISKSTAKDILLSTSKPVSKGAQGLLYSLAVLYDLLRKK